MLSNHFAQTEVTLGARTIFPVFVITDQLNVF